MTTTQTSNNKTVRICSETFPSEGISSADKIFQQVFPGREILKILKAPHNGDTLFEIFSSPVSGENFSTQDRGIYHTLIDRFGRLRDVRFLPTGPGWEIVQIYPYMEQAKNLHQYVIFQRKETDNLSLGRALIFSLQENSFLQIPRDEIPIPFAPDIVCPSGERGMWIAVKSDLLGPPQFCIVDAELKNSRPFLTSTFIEGCSVPEMLFVEDNLLLVMTNCQGEDNSQGIRSKVWMLDAKNETQTTDPMLLLGKGNVGEQNIYSALNGFWIKTTSLSEGFGYLTFATWNPFNGWEKELEYSFSGIEHSWIIAVHPSEKNVAVAYNNRLEIVGETFHAPWVEKFEDPITYLDWYSDTVLVVGTGGKLFQVNIKERTWKEWLHTRSGIVSKVLQLAPEPTNYPSEEILNGIVVDEVQFQSERAGKDVQAIELGEQHPAILDWEITYLSNPVDWLLWYQNLYFNKTYLHLGLIPYSWGDYIPSVWLCIKPIINQELVDDKLSVPKTRYVRVQVVKNRMDPRRILFIWAQSLPQSFRSDKDPREVRLLVDILSRGPHYFLCDEISELIDDAILSNFGIVVIEARAIAGGLISIKDLLDYVFQGGNLLILGDYWPEGSADLFSYWLTPLGVLYDPKQRFDGNLPIEMNDVWDWNEKQINIVGGGTLKSIMKTSSLFSLPDENFVSNAKQVACVLRNYGYGKIIVLSSRTPLTSKELLDNDNKTFAISLFQRLTYSETEFPDTDGDGLWDTLEDHNQNGIIDEGETNPYVKDSDNDGIPDGDEDQNRNGLWDENETDPTCEDSDGDGIPDGTDISPIPASGKQIITRIDPAEAFAEGGAVAFVQGRNFTNDTQFMFGRRLSPSVRILSPKFALVVIPEFFKDEGGKVFVYPTEGRNKIKTEPGKPFFYKPRNKVEVRISDIPYPEDRDTTKNIKRIQITPSTESNNLKKVYFLLRIRKGGPPAIKMEDNKWNVKITPIKDEWYLITAEREQTGFTFRPFKFEIVPTMENIQEEVRNLYIPEITRVWAETAYQGRLTTEVIHEN